MRAVIDPILHDEDDFDDPGIFAPPTSVRHRPRIEIPPQSATEVRHGRASLLLAAVIVLAVACAGAGLAKGRGLKTKLLRLITPGASATLVRPSLINSRPCDGAAQVLPDADIAVKLFLPNGAVEPATLNAAAVRLARDTDGATVPVALSLADDHSVAIRLTRPLDPHTRYTVEFTDALRDVRGAAMTPGRFSFTTGRTIDADIRFERVPLPTTAGTGFTCVQAGPDAAIWAGADDGRIFRFPVRPDGTLATPKVITSLQTSAGGKRLLTGFCFDPSSNAEHPVVWVSHGVYAFENAPDMSGTLSRMSEPDLSNVLDVVVHLPRSIRDHLNNQPVFGPDGAIYFGQGSNSSYGAADPLWGHREQHLLSAAILRLDVTKLSHLKLPLDARTADAGGSYDPFSTDAPLTIYASGVRQAWDLVWHSNGQLYAPVNGSAAGGNTPAGHGAPALSAIPDAEHDWLFRVIPGRYYGHPNRLLGHYVLNGGNPSAAAEPFEVPQYPVGTKPEANWEPPVYDFGNHVSANGVIEYRSRTAFGGKLAGWLIVCRYNVGADLLVLEPDHATGEIRSAAVGIPGFGKLANPLDVTEDVRTGNLYVSEYGAQRLVLLRPAS
jgi:glucose/arabinose dehydrogenase